MSSVAERVAKGAALLDEKRPGWAERIDLDTLQMRSTCNCILGQEYPPGLRDAGYWVGLDELGVYPFGDRPAHLGFRGLPWEGDWDELEAEWRRLITERRAA